jgi:xanthine dehydrogenase YagS FAD-binding subunit
MTPFRYEKASDQASAIALFADDADARNLAGGTNLVDRMREAVERPARLIDVSELSTEIVELDDGRLLIGAGGKNSVVAGHGAVRDRFPLVAQAILSGASGQIRNVASVGGNLLQRRRCYYLFDDAAHCNKCDPGSGCDAVGGFNRIHAILGGSAHRVATHPSDLCVALCALDAMVRVLEPRGERTVKLVDLHRLPGATPEVETVLEPGELITAVDLPPNPFAVRSSYRKVRDRSSYAFALISVAAALDLSEDGTIRDVRLALGSVAPKPWRAIAAEQALRGALATENHFGQAAVVELAAAVGLSGNAFKIDLARRVIVASLQTLSAAGAA